ncbi:thioredoxin [Eubacteriaceae bacterium ES2]|nr:thioredoxin [Eubacteriaceae bacterium ES2]
MSILTITNENYEMEVVQSVKPVLLDFWAPWCGPCQSIAPIIEEIAAEIFIIKVGKINVDEQPELAKEFMVMTIPTLVVLRGGVVIKKLTDAKSKAEILDLLNY